MTTLTAGDEFLVNELTDGWQYDASLTTLHDGGFVITWTSTGDQPADLSTSTIKCRVFNAHGQEVVNEFLVNEFAYGSQATSNVMALSDGGFIVTWDSVDGQQGDTSGTGTKARIFDADGQEVVTEFLVNEYTYGYQADTSVAPLSEGGFVVTWRSAGTTFCSTCVADIKARMFDANGQEVVSEFLVNEFTENSQSSPSVTALSGGGFVVTWRSYDGQQGDTSEYGIKARVFDTEGQEVISEFLVNEYTNGGQNGPSVTALPDGGFVITWISWDGQQGDASGSAIKARVFNAEGREVVSEFLVNEYTNGIQYGPSVTALADGGFVVVWHSNDGQHGDTSGSAIKARVFDAEGQEVVSEFLVNEYTNGDQLRPSVTALADGDFLVTWTSWDGQQGDTGLAVKARIFTFSNQPPEAHDDLAFVFEDQSTTGTVLLNDTDPDPADTLTVAVVTGDAADLGQAVQGAWGTLVLNVDGSYSYAADADLLDTLAAGEVREDRFDYTVSDGEDTDTATLTVTVTAIDDAETVELGNKRDMYAAGPVWVDLDGDGAPDLQGDGDQTIRGGNGKDSIDAGAGADKLYGGNGSDLLEGGEGIDTLCGGRGNDTLIGGEGPDTLVFERGGGNDVAVGFEAGVDMILLDGTSLGSANAADLDGNGTLDTLLRFKGGSAQLLDVDIADLIASDPDEVFV